MAEYFSASDWSEPDEEDIEESPESEKEYVPTDEERNPPLLRLTPVDESEFAINDPMNEDHINAAIEELPLPEAEVESEAEPEIIEPEPAPLPEIVAHEIVMIPPSEYGTVPNANDLTRDEQLPRRVEYELEELRAPIPVVNEAAHLLLNNLIKDIRNPQVKHKFAAPKRNDNAQAIRIIPWIPPEYLNIDQADVTRMNIYEENIKLRDHIKQPKAVVDTLFWSKRSDKAEIARIYPRFHGAYTIPYPMDITPLLTMIKAKSVINDNWYLPINESWPRECLSDVILMNNDIVQHLNKFIGECNGRYFIREIKEHTVQVKGLEHCKNKYWRVVEVDSKTLRNKLGSILTMTETAIEAWINLMSSGEYTRVDVHVPGIGHNGLKTYKMKPSKDDPPIWVNERVCLDWKKTRPLLESVNLFDLWVNSKGKAVYSEVRCTGGKLDYHILNTWGGFVWSPEELSSFFEWDEIEPNPDNEELHDEWADAYESHKATYEGCLRKLQLILELGFRWPYHDNDDSFKYWWVKTAMMLQTPWMPMVVNDWLVGDQGQGKTWLNSWILFFYGMHGQILTKMDDGMGRFTDATNGIIRVIFEEARIETEKDLSDLKNLTGTTQRVENKYKGTYYTDNCKTYGFASNPLDRIYSGVDMDEARRLYFMFTFGEVVTHHPLLKQTTPNMTDLFKTTTDIFAKMTYLLAEDNFAMAKFLLYRLWKTDWRKGVKIIENGNTKVLHVREQTYKTDIFKMNRRNAMTKHDAFWLKTLLYKASFNPVDKNTYEDWLTKDVSIRGSAYVSCFNGCDPEATALEGQRPNPLKTKDTNEIIAALDAILNNVFRINPDVYNVTSGVSRVPPVTVCYDKFNEKLGGMLPDWKDRMSFYEMSVEYIKAKRIKRIKTENIIPVWKLLDDYLTYSYTLPTFEINAYQPPVSVQPLGNTQWKRLANKAVSMDDWSGRVPVVDPVPARAAVVDVAVDIDPAPLGAPATTTIAATPDAARPVAVTDEPPVDLSVTPAINKTKSSAFLKKQKEKLKRKKEQEKKLKKSLKGQPRIESFLAK